MSTAVTERQARPLDQFRVQMQKMAGEIKPVLPSHIPVERFTRTVLTAVQRAPDLLDADRRSLFQACMQCAQDGLLPDGKEAALVVYNVKDGDAWRKAVQYIPMIAGIRKKVRQSGEIVSWEARLVHENDEFEVVFGDEERIHHVPDLFNPGKLVAVYSIAVFKSGERSREVMTVAQVEAIRSKSRSKSGPWHDPVFYPEMVKKTMLRRHAKALPLSAELDELIRRDDALYQIEARAEAPRPGVTLAARPSLEDFVNARGAPGSGSASAAQAGSHAVPDLPEVIGMSPADAHAAAPACAALTDQAGNLPSPEASAPEEVSSVSGADANVSDDDPLSVAYQRGERDRRSGKTERAVPPDLRSDTELAKAWRDGWRFEDRVMAAEREMEDGKN